MKWTGVKAGSDRSIPSGWISSLEGARKKDGCCWGKLHSLRSFRFPQQFIYFPHESITTYPKCSTFCYNSFMRPHPFSGGTFIQEWVEHLRRICTIPKGEVACRATAQAGARGVSGRGSRGDFVGGSCVITRRTTEVIKGSNLASSHETASFVIMTADSQ